MAKITFDLEELLEIIVSNGLLPRQIARLRKKGDRIHFVIKTNTFILPFIPASLGYVSFDGNHAIFELILVSGHVNKAMGMLQQTLNLQLPDFVRFEYPKVFVDIDRLLEEKNIKGIQVKDIILENDQFVIVTGSPRTEEM